MSTCPGRRERHGRASVKGTEYELYFSEAFPSLGLKGRAAVLLEDTIVTKVTTPPDHQFLNVYLESDHIITKDIIREVEREIRKQVINNSRTTVHIIETFKLKVVPDLQKIYEEYSDSLLLEVEEQQHSSPDEQFLSRAIDCVKQHLDDGDYDREQFASDMCVSTSTLYNKLRALTGQNITSFINSIRLKEACRILRQHPDIKMTELSMTVGFNTPKYFTKLFKKEFGVLPSEYLNTSEN